MLLPVRFLPPNAPVNLISAEFLIPIQYVTPSTPQERLSGPNPLDEIAQLGRESLLKVMFLEAIQLPFVSSEFESHIRLFELSELVLIHTIALRSSLASRVGDDTDGADVCVVAAHPVMVTTEMSPKRNTLCAGLMCACNGNSLRYLVIHESAVAPSILKRFSGYLFMTLNFTIN